MNGCEHCGGTRNLMIHNRYKNGGGCYMCRECNTKRLRKYRKTASGKAAVHRAVKRSVKKDYAKQMTRLAVFYAIRRGDLKKPVKCGQCHAKTLIFGHHDDYSKPLDVRWLCRSCHQAVHNELKRSKIKAVVL